MAFRLQELADHVGAIVDGDADREVSSVRDLTSAEPEDLAFLTDLKHFEVAAASRAGALVVPVDVGGLPHDLLRCEDPELAMSKLLVLFQPVARTQSGIHATAVVGVDCRIAATATVGAYTVIGDGCNIGEECVIDGQVWIGDRVEIGRNSCLHAQVVVYDDSRLGENVTVHSGTVLGADGFGYVKRDGEYHKMPQVGRVCIEDDVEIGANSAVDRATLEETRIGKGTKIDNLVQVGHNVDLGAHGMLCSQVGIAGSSKIGKSLVAAGQSGIADHLTIGDGVTLGAKSAILRDTKGYQVVGGIPAIPYAKWRRQSVLFGKLDELNRRIKELERKLREREETDS